MNRLIKLFGIVAMAGVLVGCAKQAATTGQEIEAGVVNEVDEVTSASKSNEASEMEEGIEEGTTPDSEQTERVVVGSVALVKILDELGVNMVGVPTSSYTLPESVASATRIGEAMTPDMEVIMSLEPSVVVSLDSLSESYITSFTENNIDSVVVNLSSYEALRKTITTLGKRFGKEEEANKLLASFDERQNTIMEQISGKETPSVLIIFGTPASFMMATEQSYVGDLVKLMGGVNVVEDNSSSFISVNMEYLADKNPDIILTMSHASPEMMKQVFANEFETNELWQHFDAVKEGRVYNLDSNYIGMSADLMVMDALDMLVDILYK